MNECIICSKKGIFKIKGEKIYYCKEHAQEFFPIDALESVSQLEKGVKHAEVLKRFILRK